MPKKITEDKKSQILHAYSQNKNCKLVSQQCGVSYNTVKNLVSQPPPDCDDYSSIEDALLDFKSFAVYLLKERLNPVKARHNLDSLSELQLLNIYNVLTDKMLKIMEIRLKHKKSADLENLNDNLISLAAVIQNPEKSHNILNDITP